MKSFPIIILSFCLSACGTEPATRTLQVAPEPRADAPKFSFDEIAEPSLREIDQGQFRTDLGDKRYALTNVDNSFDRFFTMILDEQRGMHIMQDKQGRALFEGRVDGVPRYAARVMSNRANSKLINLNSKLKDAGRARSSLCVAIHQRLR